MELQQSPLYAKYISALKWQIVNVDGVRMFYKKIPLLGGLLKIQRPKKLPHIPPIDIKTIAIEPIEHQNIAAYKKWVTSLEKKYHVVRSGYMPTKTILVDLKPPQEKIFDSFSEAKRRAVRKAIKNGVTVSQSQNQRSAAFLKKTGST